MDNTLVLIMKCLSKSYLQFLSQLVKLPAFQTVWFQVLNRMEMYIKAKFRGKHSEKLQELIPELLRNILQVAGSLPCPYLARTPIVSFLMSLFHRISFVLDFRSLAS